MKWKVIHKNGKEWTESEIRDLEMPNDWVERVAIDTDGSPLLLGRTDRYCYADEVTTDMVTVYND